MTAATCVFYAPLWWPGLVLTKRDAYRFFLPIKRYLVERLTAGELPQWFPYEALGRPFLAEPGTGTFHPFTLLYLALPIPDAHRLATLLCCLAAGSGCHVLGRILGLPHGAAVVSGAVFAGSGYLASLTDNLLYLYSLAMLPWFVWGLERTWRRPGATAVVPALVWATVFLNGDFQTGYLYGFVAVIWAAARVGRDMAAWTRFLVIVVLAALLAGVQIMPTVALYQDSYRVQSDQFVEEATRWSTHPFRMVTVFFGSMVPSAQAEEFAAQALGSGVPGGAGAGHWAESLYVGMAVFVLVGRGLRGAAPFRVYAWLLLGSALLALGKYGGLYMIFYHAVPLWSAFRYPEKLFGIATFATAMLAGAGAATRPSRPLLVWLVLAGASGAVGLSWAAGLLDGWLVAACGITPELAALAGRELAGGAGWSMLILVTFAGLEVPRSRAHLSEMLVTGVMTVVLLADLWRVNHLAVHTGSVEAATFHAGLAEAIVRHADQRHVGPFRIVTAKQDRAVVPKAAEADLDRDGLTSMLVRQSLDVEHNADFHLESVLSYLVGQRPELANFTKLMAANRFGPEAYGRYNVGYFIGRRGQFNDPIFRNHLVAVLPAYDLAVAENPAPIKPRAYVSLHAEPSRGPVSLTKLIAHPDFLFGDLDVVEGLSVGLVSSTQRRITFEHYAPELVRLRVEVDTPSVVILLDGMERGWRASLEDGRSLAIMRANGVVRAVEVPAGFHMVLFAYETPGLTAGLFMTIVGSLTAGGLVLRERRRTN